MKIINNIKLVTSSRVGYISQIVTYCYLKTKNKKSIKVK